MSNEPKPETTGATLEQRTRFALLPVRTWLIAGRYREAAGWLWLRRVVETKSGWGQWFAWANRQPPQ